MRILLTGAAGQLGRHLLPVLVKRGEVVTSARLSGEIHCDLTEANAVAGLLDQVIPDVIVNTAAWTAVDLAEDEPELAYALNRDLPSWLGDWCALNDGLLVHYSTDYVFSGQPDRAWRETDVPAPESVYGKSKLAGEEAIAASGCRAVVIRTAWLYSRLPGNFLSAILGRARRGQALAVVADQTGSPTWAGDLAEATGALLDRREALAEGSTLFHVTGQGAVSWYEFARQAVAGAAEKGLLERPVKVEPIASDRWPHKAPRPAWSVLDGSRFEQFAGRPLPAVGAGLTACLEQWRRSA